MPFSNMTSLQSVFYTLACDFTSTLLCFYTDACRSGNAGILDCRGEELSGTTHRVDKISSDQVWDWTFGVKHLCTKNIAIFNIPMPLTRHKLNNLSGWVSLDRNYTLLKVIVSECIFLTVQINLSVSMYMGYNTMKKTKARI